MALSPRPILSPLGVVAWMGYLWAYTGTPFIWARAERAWDDSFDPLTLVTRFLRHETDQFGHRLPHILPVVGFLFCVAAIVLLVRARPPSVLVVYSVVVVAIAASSRIVGLRPRLIETAFPLVVVFGYWLKGTVHSTVLAMSSVALGGLVLLTMTSGRFVP
jgi:hypothetical protein